MVFGSQLFVTPDESVGDDERESRIRLWQRDSSCLELGHELATKSVMKRQYTGEKGVSRGEGSIAHM